tara:strand:+ start:597 stop:791 length:195 start_codon:yes stop_codon:yes gene_type:complete
MIILKTGKTSKLLKGECSHCGCKVACIYEETKTLIDRDTVEGMATQYVACPECGVDFLWVQETK